MTPLEDVMELFPDTLRRDLLSLPEWVRERAEEVRLRVGQPVSVTVGARDYRCVGAEPIRMETLYDVLEQVSRHSVHTVLERMKSGFVPIRGGHRIGLCGSCKTEHGKGSGFRELSSLNLRIAREVRGGAESLVSRLQERGELQSTLILAPPGAGKTTLLRDLIRCISDGIGTDAKRVGVADERGELGALWEGRAQMDLGRQSDLLDGLPKAEASLMLLRGMNPQVIAMDEITEPSDVEAVVQAAGCGVTLLATAHGASIEGMKARPIYRTLLRQNVFRQAVLIHCDADGTRSVEVEEIPWYGS